MPPQARSPGPINVQLPPEEVTKQIRLVNALFNPKSVGSAFQMVGRVIGDLGRNLMKTIVGQSQAIASILEPVFVVLGIIGDFLVLTLLPQIKQFYQALAGAAKSFIQGARGAGAGSANVDTSAMGSLFAAFISQLLVALVPVITSLVDIIVKIINTPGFMATLILIVADIVLVILDGIVQIADGVVLAMQGLLDDDFFASVASFIGTENAQALINQIKTKATDLVTHTGDLITHSFNLIFSWVSGLITDLLNPHGVIWGILEALLKGIINWMKGGDSMASKVAYASGGILEFLGTGGGSAFDPNSMTRKSAVGHAFDWGLW